MIHISYKSGGKLHVCVCVCVCVYLYICVPKHTHTHTHTHESHFSYTFAHWEAKMFWNFEITGSVFFFFFLLIDLPMTF